jgi:hypothetical protein
MKLDQGNYPESAKQLIVISACHSHCRALSAVRNSLNSLHASPVLHKPYPVRATPNTSHPDDYCDVVYRSQTRRGRFARCGAW